MEALIIYCCFKYVGLFMIRIKASAKLITIKTIKGIIGLELYNTPIMIAIITFL